MPAPRKSPVDYHLILSSLVIVALGWICAVSNPDAIGRLFAPLHNVVRHNSTLESALKNGKFLLNYAGLMVPGELCVRFVGLLALCFAFTTNFLRPWATVNLITFALETGLLLRAMWLTWRVVSDRWRQKFFSERELALYTAHFEMHCLSKREFRALLDAGAEWRSWEPAEEGHGRHWTKLKGALTMEGKPTRSIMMITRGECVVVKGGVEVGRLGVGSLVGEMDFVLRLSDHMNSQEEQVPASASVIPSGDLSYVAWPKDKLAQHMAKSSYTKASVLTLIAAAQAGKLNATNERVKQRAEQLVMVQLQRCGDPGDESS